MNCLLIYLLTLSVALAQSSLTGEVRDDSDKPMPFASVLLVRASDSLFVKGGVTSEKGQYGFDNVKTGQYRVVVSMVGYQTVKSSVVIVTDAPGPVVVPLLMLTEAAGQLDEVAVTAQKPLFEQQIDRLVINVQSSITASGSTALDVLERSPGVTVDRQGGVLSLVGKSGIRVMIDGKISRLPTDALVQMLAGMSASSIEKIELITTPSARFDAEGDGGFINIILRKNTALGTNGNLDATLGYGYYEKPTAALSLNHRTHRLNVFGDYSLLYDHGWRQLDMYWQTTIQNQQTRIYTVSDRIMKSTVHNARAGFDFALSPKTTVAGLLMGFDNKQWMAPDNDSRTTQDGQLVRQVHITDIALNQWRHLMGNLNLRHTFSVGQELSIDLDHLRYFNTNLHDYVNRYTFAIADLPPTDYLRISKKTPVRSWVAKVDYTRAIGSQTKVEFGGKSTIFRLQNEVAVTRNQTGQWETDSLLSQQFAFIDDVHAAYAALHRTLSARTKIQAGLRYEFTHTYIRSFAGEALVRRRYGNWFPSIFLSRELNKSSSIQVGYSRRIERPSYTLLAPYIFFTDPSTATAGNPLLLPTLTSSVQTVFRFRDSYLLTLNYSRDRNAINQFTLRTNSQENRSVYVPENIRLQQTMSLSFGFPVRLTPIWQLQGNLMGIWSRGESEFDNKAVQVQKWYGSANLSTTIKLLRAFTAELTGNYQLPSLLGLQQRRAQGFVNVGVQKKLNEGKGSLKLTITDLFWTNRTRTTSGVEALNTSGGWMVINEPRVVRLTYSRSFGSNTVKAATKRSTASEEERKRL